MTRSHLSQIYFKQTYSIYIAGGVIALFVRGPDPVDVPGDHHPRDLTSMPHGMLRRASTTDIGLGTNAAALTTARLGDTSTVSMPGG